MQELPKDQAVRARADLITSILLVGIGIWIFYLSYEMPRLEARRVHPSTIPGLVPMALGAALALCGALLAWRSWRVPGQGGWSGLAALFTTMTAARVAAAMVLIGVFALVLIGWLPFWAASMLFIFAFIVTFELILTDQPVPAGRSLIWAAATAILCGGGIYYLFTQIFLVRLP
jgi:putative tricarboxylic transport membrane protein